MKPTLTSVCLVLISTIFFNSCEDGMDIESVSENNSPQSASSSSGALEEVYGYTFTGEEGDPITLETAQRWMDNYSAQNPNAIRAHFFGHQIIQHILSQEGAIGIRIYYALDDEGNKQLLLIGADANGNDLLPEAGAESGDGGGNTVADASYPCPSFCPEK